MRAWGRFRNPSSLHVFFAYVVWQWPCPTPVSTNVVGKSRAALAFHFLSMWRCLHFNGFMSLFPARYWPRSSIIAPCPVHACASCLHCRVFNKSTSGRRCYHFIAVASPPFWMAPGQDARADKVGRERGEVCPLVRLGGDGPHRSAVPCLPWRVRDVHQPGLGPVLFRVAAIVGRHVLVRLVAHSARLCACPPELVRSRLSGVELASRCPFAACSCMASLSK